MKKMTRRNKKGFTLAEIMLVIAIIVIVSAAAVIGVAVTLNSAKSTTSDLEKHNEEFENDAWAKVKSITQGAAEMIGIQKHVPDKQDETEPSESETEPEDEPGGAGGGEAEPSETKQNTPTPKPKVTNTPTPSPTPKPATTGGTKPDNISNLPGTVTTGKTDSAKVNVGNAQNWGVDAREVNVKGDKPIYSITVRVEGGSPVIDDTDWRYSVKDCGNGVFEVTYTSNSQWNKPIDSMKFMYKSDHGTSTSKVQVQSIQYYEE